MLKQIKEINLIDDTHSAIGNELGASFDDNYIQEELKITSY